MARKAKSSVRTSEASSDDSSKHEIPTSCTDVSDLANIVCQVLRTKPLRAEGKLELRWSLRGSFFPAYAIDATALVTAVDKTRDIISGIVSAIQASPDSIRDTGRSEGGEPSLNRLFATLAAAGSEIHHILFPTKKDAQADIVSKWLKGLVREDRVGSLEIQIEDRCDMTQDGPMPAVPWNLVYDGYVDVEELTEAFGTDAAATWSRFWGVRFDLSCGQNVNPLKADHRIDPKTARAVIVMDEVISGRLLADDAARGAFEGLMQRIESIATEAPDDSEEKIADVDESSGKKGKTTVVTVLHDVNDLKRYVRKNGLPNLLYWLSHARPDALYLEFAEDESGLRKPFQEVKLYDLEQILSIEQEGESDESDRPRPPQRKLIAFLNGCQTSEASEQGSFLRSFTRFDQVSGLISTEQETLDAFAHQFGMKFLAAFFLERKPVGTILRDLRRATLPLGLLYGTYCPPSIRLARPRNAKPPAPIPVAISDYLGQSLRKLSAASLASDVSERTSKARPGSTITPWPEKPYPSLGYYSLADQALFMGREEDSARLAMTIDSPSVRILLLHGTSGTGKSSVMRAGLVPYLENYAVGYRFPRRFRTQESVESEQLFLFFRPSDDFTGRLAAELIAFTAEPYMLLPRPDGTPIPPVNLRPVLARCVDETKVDVNQAEVKVALDDPNRDDLLCEILDAITAAIPEKLVVTVDQAEEIYTLAQGGTHEEMRFTERRRKRAYALLRCCLRGSGRWKLILSYRTEYHGRITDGLRTGLKATPGLADYLLTDLNRSQLKAVIERPTLDSEVISGLESPRLKYGFIYDEGVIDAIVDGIFRLRGRNTDSVLPIAQVICAQLYEEARASAETGQPIVKITREMLERMRGESSLTDDLSASGGALGGIDKLPAEPKSKRHSMKWRMRSGKRSDPSEPVLNILEKYADRTLSALAETGNRNRLERLSNRIGRILPRSGKILEGSISTRVRDIKRLMSDLFHRQPDGSLTTDEISKRFAIREYWRGTAEDFDKALDFADQARLLRVESATGSDDSEEATIRLGHDILGAVANRWAVAAKRKELRNKFLIRSAAACVILALSGFYLWWNNLELTQANGVAEYERQRADLAAEDMRKQRDRAESARAEALRQMHLANALNANANVMLAQNLFDQGLHAEASAKLEHVGSEFRTFPWSSLRNQIRNTYVDFDSKPHGDFASFAASHEGRLITAISDERNLKIWEFPGLTEIRMLETPGEEIRSIVISPDERALATAHKDGSVKIWDTKLRRKIRTFAGSGGLILSLAFSPDGTLLATGSYDRKIRLWDTHSGELKATFGSHAGAVTSLAFSPVGKILASGSDDDSIRIWKFDSGKELRSLFGHRGDVNCIIFSHDGRFLASGADDNSMILWNPSSGREIRAFNGHLGGVTSIAFSNDSIHLVSGSRDASIRIWDVASGKELRTHAGLTSGVDSLAISPNGKTMISVASDGVVRFWNLSSLTLSQKFTGHTREVGSLAISPDGRTLASGSSDRSIKLWDIATGKEIRQLMGHDDWVLSVGFSPDGKSLASGASDFEIKTWDLTTGRETGTLLGHEDTVRQVAYSPDGKMLASASSDRTVMLWDLESGESIASLKGHTDWVRCLAFAPDGLTLATGSFDHSIRIWNLATRSTILILDGHDDSVFDLSYSPDGKLLASSSADRSIRLWEPGTGKHVATFTGHQDVARSVAFSPDGRTLASGGDDRTTRLWDIRTKQEIRKTDFESPVYALRFGSDRTDPASRLGTRIAVASGKSISIFDSNFDEIEDRSRRYERIARSILSYRTLYDEALAAVRSNVILNDDDKTGISRIVQRLIDIEHARSIAKSIPLPEDAFQH